MDQRRIFSQLNTLERSAREESARSKRDEQDDYDAEFLNLDFFGSGHERTAREYRRQTPQPQYIDSSAELGLLDDPLLYHHTHRDSWYTSTDRRHAGPHPQAGNAYPEAWNGNRDFSKLQPNSHKSDLSRFLFNSDDPGLSSPSMFKEPLQSSPMFGDNQLRSAPLMFGEDSNRLLTLSSDMQSKQSHGYIPTSVEEIDAEERETHAAQPAYDHPPQFSSRRCAPQTKRTNHGPPVVQGITLVSTRELPDRFRAVFPFPLFNAVQSKSFDIIYNSNDNFVLSSPTGSGKTAILELAICRLVNGFATGTFKVVYQAPTKSLCAERQRDWQAKFGPLDLQCAELTGDTEITQLRNVQHASIIITTPEKWDSITRKWKDHHRLMQMVKLCLIDEVHILKEDRGATLEAVVSRMKSVGSDIRFIALSATVPNSQDISTWLGKDPMNPHIPAPRERFGEEFRPVRLQRHVCGYQGTANDFAFDKTLNAKLPGVIAKWSQHKPIMVFCLTRSSCVETAKLLANLWASKGPGERYWDGPRGRIVVGDKDLREIVLSGVAFHHAGLTGPDRSAVEKGYLEGEVNVICCTSTLAVGVNLPCHMVIIKHTVSYQNSAAGGCKEYSDLEIMQMLGRAGRPQFDNSAVAVIMTKLPKVQHYERMITGKELLESCLHRNLIDHLNAEIGLGTVTCASSAKKWLSGTFLYVRLKENPDHYKIDGSVPGGTLDERLESICRRGIALLEEHRLVESAPRLHCTEFGDAMARYYLQFDTMKVFLALPPKAKVSEILSAMAQAAEFRSIRFRAGEKAAYKDLNKNASIKFPIPVNLDGSAHKVSLIIQSVLGALELPTEDGKTLVEYNTTRRTIFQHVRRLIRCIIDCQLHLEDAISTRNALMLARSFGAQVWDDSPLHMKQLDGVGLISVRKLVVGGVVSIDDIENADAHRLETVLSRNPPFGAQLQEKAKAFPRLRISLQTTGEPTIQKGIHVSIELKAEIGFLNDRVPLVFNRMPVYVCVLVERSDGHKVHFARISAKKLDKGQDVLFSAHITSANQTIRAYVMCDELAGTARHAQLKPDIPCSAFPLKKPAEDANQQRVSPATISNALEEGPSYMRAQVGGHGSRDEFNDADIDDADLALVEAENFVSIDDFDDAGKTAKGGREKPAVSERTLTVSTREPRQLANGKWACNHPCKDKTKCKHLCCHEGVDKKPKPSKPRENKKDPESWQGPRQTQLAMGIGKRSTLPTPAASSNSILQARPWRKPDLSDEVHENIRHKASEVSISDKRAGDTLSEMKNKRPRVSTAQHTLEVEAAGDTNHARIWDSDELPDASWFVSAQHISRISTLTKMPSSAKTGYMLDTGREDFEASSAHNNGQLDSSINSNLFEMEQNGAWEFNNSIDCGASHFEAGMSSMPTSRDFESCSVRPSNATLQKSKTLFVGLSSDSSNIDTRRVAVDEDLHHPTNNPTTSSFGSPEASHPTSTKPHSGLSRVSGPPEHNVSAPKNSRPNPVPQTNQLDSLEEWFKAEFGTEHFNYIG